MNRRLFCLVLLFVVCGVTTAHGDTYTLSLTGDWTGIYDADEYWQESVDFGLQFSSIQSVSIDWSGMVTTGYDDFLLPVRGRFESSLIESPNSIMAVASGPWSPYSYSFPSVSFDTQSAYQGANSWDFLLDGRAILETAYAPENGDYTASDVPWGDLDSVSLVVEGTAVVPEPAGLVSVALGLSGLAGAAFRRRRHR
ncbi:MAG: PEP-CTERM sorting domain-containing protein [Armatimonadota bacterium]|nr:PEP-CTERM sorting domain-containing protein [Armatimonadota bacterium]